MSHDSASSRTYTLVIDDEPEILDIVRQCLEGAGLPVLTAVGAKSGLETYEKHWREIGVILLDYVMPDMTGDLVLECLLRVNPDVRVLLLTGCDDRVARAMFDAGVRGCIQKPFYIDDLVQRVHDELSQV